MRKASEHLAGWLARGALMRGVTRTREVLTREVLTRDLLTRGAIAAVLAVALAGSLVGSVPADPSATETSRQAVGIDRADLLRAELARAEALELSSALAVAEVAADEAMFTLGTVPTDTPLDLLTDLNEYADRLGGLTIAVGRGASASVPSQTVTPEQLEDAAASVFQAAAAVRDKVEDPAASTVSLRWTSTSGLEELEALAASAVAAAERLEDPWADQEDPSADPNYGSAIEAYLCPIPFAQDHRLRCDAIDSLVGLNSAYRTEHGKDLTVESSYRTFEQQAALRATLGTLAAQPGTSNHERGVAVDLGGVGALGDFTSPLFKWLSAYAPTFGWEHPPELAPGGSGPQEPWHWEYVG